MLFMVAEVKLMHNANYAASAANSYRSLGHKTLPNRNCFFIDAKEPYYDVQTLGLPCRIQSVILGKF